MDTTALVSSDFNTICRLCLSRDRPLTCLFSNGQYEVPLYLMAETCATVDIDEDDGLPPNICCVCRDTILSSYQFREKVGRNDAILRCIVGIKPEPDEEGLNERAEGTGTATLEPSWTTERSKMDGAGGSHPHDGGGSGSNCIYSVNANKNEAEEVMGSHFLVEEDRSAAGGNDHTWGLKKKQNDKTEPVDLDGISSCSKDEWPNKKSNVTTQKDKSTSNDLKKAASMDDEVGANMSKYGSPIADGSGYCFVCLKIFCKFYEHVQLKHSLIGGFWCDHCDVWCKSKDRITRHINRAHICKNQKTKTDIDRHKGCVGRSQVFGTKKRRARRENKNSTISEEVRAKMNEFGTLSPDGKTYYCKLCGKIYRKRVFSNHVKFTHLQIRDFMCDQCGYRALTKVSLTWHIDEVHLRVKKYQCQDCPLRFCSKLSLNNHVRKHRPGKIRTSICEVCGKSYKSQDDLKRHLRGQHFPELKIKCDFCDCRYASRNKLRAHVKKLH